SSSRASRRPRGGACSNRSTSSPSPRSSPAKPHLRPAREPRLLPAVRLPEPGGRQLLREVRRAPARAGSRGGRADPDLHRGRARRAPRDARRPRDPGPGLDRPLRRRPLGRDLRAAGRAHDDRPLARLRDLPRRRHGLAQARNARAARRPLARRGRGEPERDVREPQARRDGRALGRRRAADRQIPADLPHALMTATAPSRERLLTIGTVCRRLKAEFADISISKIRYLEDQGLLTPKRTQGGYRLFYEEDVDRLETILRMQRDEFLPLRVIREELAAGAGRERRRRRAALAEPEDGLDLEELCARVGIEPQRAREL